MKKTKWNIRKEIELIKKYTKENIYDKEILKTTQLKLKEKLKEYKSHIYIYIYIYMNKKNYPYLL